MQYDMKTRFLLFNSWTLALDVLQRDVVAMQNYPVDSLLEQCRCIPINCTLRRATYVIKKCFFATHENSYCANMQPLLVCYQIVCYQ